MSIAHELLSMTDEALSDCTLYIWWHDRIQTVNTHDHRVSQAVIALCTIHAEPTSLRDPPPTKRCPLLTPSRRVSVVTSPALFDNTA